MLFLTCGCQQTPEKEAVVYGRHLTKKIEAPAASFEHYSAPSTWQETLKLKGSDTKVEINALISVPDVTAFPVYKVKYIEFDTPRIERLVDYFTKGKDVTEYTEPTKADLEKELILCKKNNNEELATEFERQIASAPETVEAKIITDWSVDNSPNGHFTEDDGIKSCIDVAPDRFSYMKGFIMSNSMLEMNGIKVDNDILISEEDAVAAAEDMLHELGIDYMVDVSLEKAQHFASIEDSYFESGEKLLSKGYLITFARNIDGVPGITSYPSGGYSSSEVIHYKAPLYPEEIQIFVDEAGLPKSFDWQNSLEITEKLNDNVSLLPFKNIQERARDMLKYVNSYDSEPAVVTDVELNMTIISVEDHPYEAMYVPAWFIYYTMVFNVPPDEDEEVYVEQMEQEYVIALNAIDGGRIAEIPFIISHEMKETMAGNRDN
jgi:hypothetical protein